MMRLTRRSIITTATATALALGLAGCAGSTADDTEGDAAQTPGGDLEEITLALPPEGWPEGVAVTHLWQAILEDQGYTVELDTAGDMGVIYTALAGGEFDLFFDAWLPSTHEDYFDKYGDDMERLGAWYDDARLTIAVNESSPITSLEELAANAETFGNRIVGIEPGAGLTRITKESVMPGYGLEGMELVESSSPAMLAELTGAIDAERDIVVTLWRPHWAYDEFPIKDLKDPEGTLGDAEEIHSIARTGFGDDFPELTGWIENWELNSELLYSLENAMYNSGAEASEYETIVADWVAENQDYVDTLTS